MQRQFLFLFLLLACSFCGGCGYKLGGAKPKEIAHIQRIYVPTFRNDTQFPRAEVFATNATVQQLEQDGTLRVSPENSAQATLEASVDSIYYDRLRALPREASNEPFEIRMTIQISYAIRDSRSNMVLLSGRAYGTTNFFNQNIGDSIKGTLNLGNIGNLQTTRANALSDAMRRASTSLVLQITNGF